MGVGLCKLVIRPEGINTGHWSLAMLNIIPTGHGNDFFYQHLAIVLIFVSYFQ
jgi:hypothetical protein